MYLGNQLGFAWQGQIVNRLPTYIWVNDVNQDVNFEGTFIRLCRLVEQTMMDPLVDRVAELISSNLAALGCQYEAELLLHLASNSGNPVNFSPTDQYARIVAAAQDLKNWRGSKKGFDKIFAIMGIEVLYFTEWIEEEDRYDDGYYDSSVLYDSFTCKNTCSRFDMDLEGAAPLTSDLITKLRAAIEYNKPINADLSAITYNGYELWPLSIELSFSSTGELLVHNPKEWDISITKNSDGYSIIADIPDADSNLFFIDSDGQLNYQY